MRGSRHMNGCGSCACLGYSVSCILFSTHTSLIKWFLRIPFSSNPVVGLQEWGGENPWWGLYSPSTCENTSSI